MRSLVIVGILGMALRVLWADASVRNIGPGGGAFASLAVDPQNPQTLYAGTLNAGVFKSTDGGASWNDGGLAGLR